MPRKPPTDAPPKPPRRPLQAADGTVVLKANGDPSRAVPLGTQIVNRDGLVRTKTSANWGGTRANAGRKPRPGKIRDVLVTLLEPFDEIGRGVLIRCMAQQEDLRLALDAVRLAWSYRHGLPTQRIEAEGFGDTTIEKGIVFVNGSEEDYVRKLKDLRYADGDFDPDELLPDPDAPLSAMAEDTDEPDAPAEPQLVADIELDDDPAR